MTSPRATRAVTPHPSQSTAAKMRIGAFALISAGTLSAAFLLKLGTCAWSAGGLFAVLTLTSVSATRENRHAWTSTCPTCDCPMRSEQLGFALTEAKLVGCWRCKQYAHGTEALAPVPDDYLHPEPVFTAPLPDHPRWPDDTEVDSPDVRGDTVWFRSIALYRSFLDKNPNRASAPRVDAGHKEKLGPPAAPTPTEVLHETLEAYLKQHPKEKDALRASLRCPLHDTAVLTAMGYRSTMHFLPSHEWMEETETRPMRLDIGERLTLPPHPEGRKRAEPARLVFCPVCEPSH
ncbi:MAG: hypothetical protein KC912_21685 [Proteobacteria bacterium]|nr:hypothetical protein [Pseudomonadota bacterium]